MLSPLLVVALYQVPFVINRLFPIPLVHRIPLKTYSILAFLTVSTMGLSNTSLNYLNYPTQVCDLKLLWIQLL